MDLATNEGVSPTATQNRKRASAYFDDDDDDYGHDDKNMNAISQYYKKGNGYIATSDTVKKLPAGIYHTLATPDGLVFDKHEIVTDDLLRLPDSKSDEVVSEIEKFWKMKTIFNKYGFSHKRGFLLYGPAGSGKTTTLAIVMKQMIENNGVVFLGDNGPSILSVALKNFRLVEPERPLAVVLEDIDTLIRTFGESEVLSILDGESSVSNVVFLATTNFPENLDGRVINRPSRFDRIVKIDMPNYEARLAYLKSRNIEIDKKELMRWAEMTEGFSVAHLKEVIIGVMCFQNNLEAEVKRLKSMAKTPSSAGNSKMGF